jgi:hypothetical protein
VPYKFYKKNQAITTRGRRELRGYEIKKAALLAAFS